MEQAITHGLGSRLELRQREIESKELEFEMIKTKALNEFKGDISLSFGLMGDNRHLNKMFNNPTQNPRVSIGGKREHESKHKRLHNKLMNLNFMKKR